ncbi:unnamed protein product [Arctogadus glacialis]
MTDTEKKSGGRENRKNERWEWCGGFEVSLWNESGRWWRRRGKEALHLIITRKDAVLRGCLELPEGWGRFGESLPCQPLYIPKCDLCCGRPEQQQRAGSPGPSCVSMERSKKKKKKDGNHQPSKKRRRQQRADSPGPSCVSMERSKKKKKKDGNHQPSKKRTPSLADSRTDALPAASQRLCIRAHPSCCRLVGAFWIRQRALSSNPSHLRELDLSYNHPGDSRAALLSAGLEDPRWRLDTLSVEHGGVWRMKPALKKYACDLTLDPSTAPGLLSLV